MTTIFVKSSSSKSKLVKLYPLLNKLTTTTTPTVTSNLRENPISLLESFKQRQEIVASCLKFDNDFGYNDPTVRTFK